MEEQREEIEFVGDGGEPMEEVGEGIGLSSKIATLVGEDVNTVEVSDSGVCDVNGIDENPDDGGPATEDGNTDSSVSDEKQVIVDAGSVDSVTGEEAKDYVGDVERTDAITETETETETGRNDMECEGDAGTVEVNPVDEMHGSELSAGEEESVIAGGNEVTDEKECEVEDDGGACDAEQIVQTEKSQQTSVDGEMLSVAEKKADQEKEPTKKSEEDDNKMGIDSKEANKESVGLHEQRSPRPETSDANHSESAKVLEESTQLCDGKTKEGNPGTVSEVSAAAGICREEEINTVNQKEENGEAMEIDYAAEKQVENDVKVGDGLDNASNESVGAGIVSNQDIPIAEADVNNSNVIKEMEIDERKDNADMASDLTPTIDSADLANPNSPSEDAAPGEVEPLDHNALFDPSSDITNFIDFSGVSSWSGNIQDLKTETRNVSLKEDKKTTDMAQDVASADGNLSLSAEGIETESNETRVGFEADTPAAATDCSKEASDAILGSEENQQDKKTADELDTMREEDDITHEAPSIDPKQKEDTEMEENPDNSDYADDEAGSDIKTNGVKRKADVLNEDSPGEGRKTVSLAKVSFAQRPSFKIGACIARAASQMAGSSSVLKGSNFGDETLSVESFVSQLHSAATDPVKENVVSDIAAGFFLDFRNSTSSQQVAPEKVSSKRVKLSNSNTGGTEAFEFEEMGDTYWTDRVIHNGGEEQTPPTEKENYQVVPVELKPAQVQRTRRPYRRRQSQISISHSASKKPAEVDVNAPAELIMNFSETDTIPPEKSLSKMFRHFGPIRELQTEVDREKHRARVVFKKGADAEVAYNCAGRFSIFGTKAVKFELSHTITETFKVQPYVVSLGEEDAVLCPSA